MERLKRLNRAELWLFLLGVGFYLISILLMSAADSPTKYSLALAELQTFFKGVSVVFGGLCVGVISTKHSIAKSENTILENSAIYAVRALVALAVVLVIL